jgi:hypothetical protein
VSRRRAASDATSYGLGLNLPTQPLAPPKPLAKPAPAPPAVLRTPTPVRREPPPPAPVQVAPVVELPRTPWGRVAAECPDRRGVDAHELTTEHWTCSCGWTGAALAEHRCAGVAALERRTWLHIERSCGGSLRCVPGAIERVYRWDTLEWNGGLVRVTHEKPRAPRYVPVDGLAYVDRVTSAYSAAEDAGRRACADAPAVAEKRACGCSPAGLCVVARALVERVEERRALERAGAEVPRAVWRHAFGMTDAVLRAHLAGVAVTYANGRWWAQAIRG